MEITYLGHASFKIKGKTATVVTDPFSPEMVGFKFPKTEAEIVIVSHQHKDHNYVEGVLGDPFIISLPGEYELKGVSIFCFPSFHDNKSGAEKGKNLISLIEADGLKICHLGDLKTFASPSVMEEIINVDVLMVPVGGVVTLDHKEAVEVVNQIDPLIVLPMHYLTPEINKENFSDLASEDKFLIQIGVEQPLKLEKLSVTKDTLPAERKVVILKRRT